MVSEVTPLLGCALPKTWFARTPAARRSEAQGVGKKAIFESIPGTTFDPTTGGQNGAIQLTVRLQKQLGGTQMWGRKLAPSSGVKNWFQSITWSDEARLILQWAEWYT